MRPRTPAPRNHQNLWFENGRWWYSAKLGSKVVNISSLLTETKYTKALICQHLQQSEKTFERHVHRSIGLAPKEWLKLERAVRARNLLREGRALKFIAWDLKFADTSSFCREFKQVYKITPKQFQEKEKARSFFPEK